MKQSTGVLVLGHGEMGRAMERLLAGRVPLAIWERFPPPGFRSAVLAEAVPAADLLLFCLPTAPHESVLAEVLPLLRPGSVCLSVAKGLDEAGRPVAAILDAALGSRFGYAVLHGPMIAEEIQAGRLAFGQLATRGDGVASRVLALFADTRLRITPVDDMPGCNWAAVFKNVYALAFGAADELDLGDNVRGWLAVTAQQEMDCIVQRLGGAPGTARGLAGLGDLISTSTSEHSHHRELGRRVARGEGRYGRGGGLDGEAIHTLAVLDRNRQLDLSGLPLLRWITSVVRDRVDVRSSLEELLKS